jgi:hypothetical protein
MKTFKNKSFKERDYKSLNFVFCQTNTKPCTYPEDWVEVDEAELKNSDCIHTHTITNEPNNNDNARYYYGYFEKIQID